MLAGLITAAAVKARQRVKNVAMKMEVMSLSQAMDAYKERLGEYPPDFGYVADPLSQINAVRAHIARVFPQCLPQYNPTDPVNCKDASGNYYCYLYNNLASYTPMGPNVALRFWLGGPAGNGFSADPQDPFDIKTYSQGLPPQPSRIGPFFDFNASRLAYTLGATTTVPAPTGTPPTPALNVMNNFATVTGGTISVILLMAAEYFPDNGWADAAGQRLERADEQLPLCLFRRPERKLYLPYIGRHSQRYDIRLPRATGALPIALPATSPGYLLTPYADSRLTTNASTPVWVNPKTFQILCCGLDGLYSYPTNNTTPGVAAAWGFYPGGPNIPSNYAPQSMDDIANFTTGATLQDDVPP